NAAHRSLSRISHRDRNVEPTQRPDLPRVGTATGRARWGAILVRAGARNGTATVRTTETPRKSPSGKLRGITREERRSVDRGSANSQMAGHPEKNPIDGNDPLVCSFRLRQPHRPPPTRCLVRFGAGAGRDVRDHRHHICNRTYGPTTSPARSQVGTHGSIDEPVLAGSTPVSATMFS